jgi:hypothetical protein
MSQCLKKLSYGELNLLALETGLLFLLVSYEFEALVSGVNIPVDCVRDVAGDTALRSLKKFLTPSLSDFLESSVDITSRTLGGKNIC